MKSRIFVSAFLIGAVAPLAYGADATDTANCAAVGGAVEKDGWFDFNKNGRKDVFEDAAQPIDARIEDLLGQMTLEEKAGQLSQCVTWGAAKDKERFFARQHQGGVGSYIMGGRPADVNHYQRDQIENSRLGIPLIIGDDVIHGQSMAFPISLGLACAFEPDLFEQMQTVAAREARADGIHWAFAPMCDLARDVRWGRVAETCGEDPYLVALCCAAQVRGFQGPANDVSDPTRVAACLKHYTAYSAVTGGRDYNDSQVSEWELRNQHLPSFRAAIAAGAKTVMSSFNSIGGIPACANEHTLTEILRGEWGFKGFVVSDWEAVIELIDWGFASDKADATRLALGAGNDMNMKDDCYWTTLPGEVRAGRFPVEKVDAAVRNVLRIKFELGLFERPYVDEKANAVLRTKDRVEYAPLAREAARKSVVMLKNEGALPLAATAKKIALVGPLAEDSAEPIGCWNCCCFRGGSVSVRDGFAAQLPKGAELLVAKGCSVSLRRPTKTLQDGTKVEDPDAAPVDADFNPDEAVRVAASADVVVMALGEAREMTGENTSRATLGLTGHQEKLFDAVAATGKPIVAVVFSGRPLVLPEIWKKAAAVLYVWQPGCESGNAIADLVFGKASPSGRLSVSVPRSVGHVPAYYNRPTSGRPGYSTLYVDVPGRDSAYPFGFGLTYSKFEYSPAAVVASADGKLREAVATVKNVGAREATETVQLYIRQRACHAGWRPVRELRGFRKVTLKPGESAEVRFPITDATLGYVDRNGRDVTDRGDYRLWIAPDSVSGKAVDFVW